MQPKVKRVLQSSPEWETPMHYPKCFGNQVLGENSLRQIEQVSGVMRGTPLVLIAYNRPDKIRRLIERLEQIEPTRIIFAVDGPRIGDPNDAEKVSQVQSMVELFRWPVQLETRFRDANLGLKDAVIDAVSFAISKYGQAIVLEEDTLPSENWIPFAEHMLLKFRNDLRIEHISGYNLVPERFQSSSGRGSRLSRYPESFAWATWERAWSKFDGTLDWGMNASIDELSSIVGSRLGALRWKQNFGDAHAGRISSWAYRWISSMWSRNSYVLSPNQNLVTYTGYDEGTHALMKAPWDELELFEGGFEKCIEGNPSFDKQADEWVAKHVFAETAFGVMRGVAISVALQARKEFRQRRQIARH